MSDKPTNKDCPDYLPKYVAISRFTHWLNHAQLDNDVWEQLFDLGKEHGFVVSEPLDGEQP